MTGGYGRTKAGNKMLVDLPRVLRELSARVKAEKNQWRRATDQKFYHETMETTLVGGRHVHSFVASKRVSLTGIILLSSIPPFLDGRHLTRSLLHSLLPLPFFLFFPLCSPSLFRSPFDRFEKRERTSPSDKCPGEVSGTFINLSRGRSLRRY